MTEDYWSSCDIQYFVHNFIRDVRKVNQHAKTIHLFNHTLIKKAKLLNIQNRVEKKGRQGREDL